MKDEWIYFGIFSVIVALMLGWWVMGSKFEADAYFRVTGKNVSTWDAMWVELRVQDSPK